MHILVDAHVVEKVAPETTLPKFTAWLPDETGHLFACEAYLIPEAKVRKCCQLAGVVMLGIVLFGVVLVGALAA